MPDQHADTPDEAALVERIARVLVSQVGQKQGIVDGVWRIYAGDARRAIAKMQPEIAAAHEAGRREMADKAAGICDEAARQMAWVGDDEGATTAMQCAVNIRALVQPGAATEAGHG